MPHYVYRLATVFIPLVVFLGMSYLYAYGDQNVYAQILTAIGIWPFQFPFLDISAWLAVWECARQGVDVISVNPCDVLQRGYSASPLWIEASAIPLGVRDTAVVGWLLDLVFLISLSLLPSPQDFRELMLVLAAILSTMVIFALERANPDVLLFIMTLTTGVLVERRLYMRMLGYLLALLASLLKYYPIMVLIIALRERASMVIAVSLVIAGSLVAFWTEYHVEIARGLPAITHGPYNTDLFAAKNLPFLFGEAAGGAAGKFVAGVAYATLVGVSLSICRRLLRFDELRSALATLDAAERNLLVIGSAVIVGCFFAGQSVGYRGVYFLLAMPGLLAISRRPAGSELRHLALGTSVVILLLMWGECFRLALYRAVEHPSMPEVLGTNLKIQFWFLRELGWWWTVSVMLAVLIDFLAASPLTHWVSSRFASLGSGHKVTKNAP
jgi:hypothetical protein